MSTESNKAIVRRYFEEVVDKRNLQILTKSLPQTASYIGLRLQNQSGDWKHSSSIGKDSPGV
jgi:hypothetical protein